MSKHLNDGFMLSEELIPLAKVTEEMLKGFYDAKPSANMYGNWDDLATYTLINIVHSYRLFYDYSEIKNDITIFATLTRSSLELLSDLLYALGHKDSKKSVDDLLSLRRFGAHAQYEYFEFVKNEIDEMQICEKPDWTESTQSDRIKKFGGNEELLFYNLLCAYTHQSIPNHRQIVHPNEVYLIRSYFLGKQIKYLYDLSKAIGEKSGTGTGTRTLDKALKKYRAEIEHLVEDWSELFSSLYKFTDHEGNFETI